jgi:CMP/dCMP kinase
MHDCRLSGMASRSKQNGEQATPRCSALGENKICLTSRRMPALRKNHSGRAKADLNPILTDTGGHTRMATITISRHFGAGGATLGSRLAKRLGYRYVDDELIKEVARKTGVAESQVRTFEKSGTSKLMKLLDWVVSPEFIERHTSEKTLLTEERYVEEIKTILGGLHQKGNVVIVGRGANYALKGYPKTMHVFLVADMDHRVRFLCEKYHMTKSEAERAVKRSDMIRTRFLNCFSPEGNHDEPLLYTIILNMNDVTMDRAEDILVSLAQDIERTH